LSEYRHQSRRVLGHLIDSLYVHAEPLLKFLYPNFNILTEEEKENLLEKEAIKYQNLINEHYNKISPEIFNIDTHYFEMKTEAVISSAYFRATRRYAQWIKKKEGVPVDELDIKGLEYKKTNFPKVFGDFIEGILEQVLKGANKEKVDSQILGFKQRILNGEFKIKELGNPTSIKTLNKYFESPPPKGEIFSKYRIKAPASVKASIVYNDLINYFDLGKKGYTKITQGDKIKWIYLSDNPYKIEAISFLEFNLPPQIEELILNHIDYNKIFDSVFLNKISGLYEDLDWNLNLNPYTTQFFEWD